MYEGYLLATLFVGFFAVLIGAYAYLRHSLNPVNSAFFPLSFTIGVTLISQSMMILSKESIAAAVFAGLYAVSSMALYLYMVLFMLVFTHRLKRFNITYWLPIFPAVALVMLVAGLMPTTGDLKLLPYGYDYDLMGMHALAPPFLMGTHIVAIGLGLWALFTFRGRSRDQAAVLSAGLLLTFTMKGVIGHFVAFGTFPVPMAGPTAVMLYFFAFGISRYRLVGNLRAKYSQLVENFPLPLYVVDDDGTISNCNPEALKLMHLSDRKEVVSTRFGTDRTGYLSGLMEPLGRAMDECRVMTLQSVEVDLPNPGRRYFDVRLVPVDGTDEAMVILNDVTDIRMAQETLRSSKEHAEFYTDLLSHDINNFNTAVMNYLGMILMDPGISDDSRRFAETSLEQVRASSHLIDNTRTLSRVRFGSDSFVGPVNLTGVVDEVRRRVLESLPEKDLEIRLHEPQSEPWVMGNEFLHDIFSNLFHNACKYDPAKKCVIDVWMSKSYERGQGWWTVSVDDRGEGVPDDKKGILFERFQRNSGMSGTGLGLSIVRMAVEGMGGSARISDRVAGDHRKGASFKLRLRVAPPERVRTAVAKPLTQGRPSGARGVHVRAGAGNVLVPGGPAPATETPVVLPDAAAGVPGLAPKGVAT